MAKKKIEISEEVIKIEKEKSVVGVTKCFCGNISTIRSAKGNVFCSLACQASKGE